MGKHKNSIQNSIILDFMEKHADIAKGFTKSDKPYINSQWEQLTASLNGAGPPQKDVTGWKKIWTEWKSDVKKKMVHNKIEARATGGGPFSKYQLTPTEEAIARICGMKSSVEGAPGIALGQPEEPAPGILFVEVAANTSLCCNDDDSNGEEMPSTSSKRALDFPHLGSAPKVPRLKSTAERLKEFLDEDNNRKIEIKDRLEQLVKVVTELKNQFVNANTRILKEMQESNQIQQKRLDLELLKYEMEKKVK